MFFEKLENLTLIYQGGIQVRQQQWSECFSEQQVSINQLETGKLIMLRI